MYVLQNDVPLQGMLEDKFKGTSSVFDPTYPRATILRSMREMIRARIRVVSGAQYWGEAEALILGPLFECVHEAAKPDANPDEGLVTSKAYQLAAAYSLIANVCAVCEERKIAEIISMQSIVDNPLVSQLLRYMSVPASDEAADKLKKQISGTMDTTDGKWKVASASDIARQIWGAISESYGNITTEAADASDGQIGSSHNPINALFASMSMPDAITIDKDAKAIFSTFTKYLRQGKGLALNRQDRKKLMGYWAVFLSDLDTLIDLYMKTPTEPTPIFSQAYAAMYWALEYFKILDDYEAVFPSASMRLMSSLWMKSISTRCISLSKFFFKLCVTSTSFDIRIAEKSVMETEEFFAPLLERNQHEYLDYKAKWDETRSMLDSVLEPFSSEAATNLYEELKSYVGVEHFLPSKYFERVFDAIEQDYSEDEDSSSIILKTTGLSATQKINMSKATLLLDRAGGLSETSELPGVLTVIADLSLQAQAIWDLVHFLDKAQDSLKIVTESAGDLWAAIIAPPSFINLCPLQGRIGEIRDADFQMHSPYQMLTDKYETAAADALKVKNKKPADNKYAPDRSYQRWKWTQYLMVPINKLPALREAAKDRSELSRIVWPFQTDVPVGDPLTNPYMRIPIPAVYTDTRSTLRVDNNIDGFLSIISGHTPNASASRQFFEALATLLDRSVTPGSSAWSQDANPYLLPIVNSLAGIMFIDVNLGGSKWQWLQPSIPTVYGAPLATFRKMNATDQKTEKDTSFAFFSSASGRSAYYTMQASGRQYRFTLHEWFPVPGKYKTVSIPFSRSTYVSIPVLEDFWDNMSDKVKAALNSYVNGAGKESQETLSALNIDGVVSAIRDSETTALRWVKSASLYPTLMVMPHILWDFDESIDSINDNFYKLACLSIRTEWDEYLKTMRIAGFWNSPSIIMDLKDYATALDSSDPSPFTATSVSEPEDPEPAHSEPDRVEAQPVPAPETVAPAAHKPGTPEPDNATLLNQTGEISNTPIMAKVDDQLPRVHKPDSQVVEQLHTAQVTGETPVAGDPKGAEVKDNQDNVTDRPKYWKKLSDNGEVEDVIKADSAPDGYVPATEEEFAAFKKSQTKSDSAAQPQDNSGAESEA